MGAQLAPLDMWNRTNMFMFHMFRGPVGTHGVWSLIRAGSDTSCFRKRAKWYFLNGKRAFPKIPVTKGIFDPKQGSKGQKGYLAPACLICHFCRFWIGWHKTWQEGWDELTWQRNIFLHSNKILTGISQRVGSIENLVDQNRDSFVTWAKLKGQFSLA